MDNNNALFLSIPNTICADDFCGLCVGIKNQIREDKRKDNRQESYLDFLHFQIKPLSVSNNSDNYC